MTVRAKCNHCGASVDSSRDESCPHCGQYAGKTIQAAITEDVGVQDSGTWARTREFLRYNWGWALALTAIVLLSPFVGLLIAGAWGIVVGLILSVLSVPVGYFAVTKMRETTQGGNQ